MFFLISTLRLHRSQFIDGRDDVHLKPFFRFTFQFLLVLYNLVQDRGRLLQRCLCACYIRHVIVQCQLFCDGFLHWISLRRSLRIYAVGIAHSRISDGLKRGKDLLGRFGGWCGRGDGWINGWFHDRRGSRRCDSICARRCSYQRY